MNKFLARLKGFIARHGRPHVIYSDNGSTFQAASDWLKKARKDEKFQSCLTQREDTTSAEPHGGVVSSKD